MNWIETLEIAVQLTTVLLLVVGFKATLKQFRLLCNVHVDNHDWNRRKAAQDATLTYKDVSTKNLQQHFNYLNTSGRISLKMIENEFDDSSELKSDLHRLLDYFDGLCRGANHGVYDEKIIKISWSGVLTRTFDQFWPYIDWYRKNVDSKAWSETEILIDRWKYDENLIKMEVREPTGTGL